VNNHTTSFYRPELDALRFLAFLLVFCHHAFVSSFIGRLSTLPWAERIPAAIVLGGEFGVDLFFILSAYLISELLIREKAASGQVQVGRFYMRRILRIWPLYFTFVVFCFILPLFTPSIFPFKAFVCFLLLSGNWYCVLHAAIPSPVSPLWSVSIEEQFYLVWPWVVRKAKSIHLIIFSCALIAIAICTRLVLAIHSAPRPSVWFNSFTHMDAIGAGILIAVLLKGRAPHLQVSLRISCFILALLLLGLSTSVFDVLNARTTATIALMGYGCGILAAVLLFLAFLGAPEDGIEFLAARKLAYLGRISYGLYVVHQFVLEAVKVTLLKTLGESPAALQLVLALGPTILLAALSYRWLESPFLRLKRRFQSVSTDQTRLNPVDNDRPDACNLPTVAPSEKDRRPASETCTEAA